MKILKILFPVAVLFALMIIVLPAFALQKWIVDFSFGVVNVKDDQFTDMRLHMTDTPVPNLFSATGYWENENGRIRDQGSCVVENTVLRCELETGLTLLGEYTEIGFRGESNYWYVSTAVIRQ